jgi:general secretion pathway protein G
MRTRTQKGFTLVEILIVVVILGILAAIVIPQFSEASTEAKISSSMSSLQSLRSQIQLYKIQHNDNPPCHGTFVAATFKEQLEQYSDAAGTTSDTKTATCIYGPYVQSVPRNPWNNSSTVATSDGTGVGWVYEADTGNIYLAVSDVTNTTAKQTLIDNGAALAAAP